MKLNYRVAPVLFGISIALLQTQISIAQSEVGGDQEVGKIAEEITVAIKGKNSDSQGSGVIIKKNNDNYIVLTAAHVVEKNDKYEIIAPGGQRYLVNYSAIKKAQNDVDIAVVKFSSKQNYNVAKFGDSNKASTPVGTKSYVAGFTEPAENSSSLIYRFIIGRITANASEAVIDGGYALYYNNSTMEGMSGGPVLNEKSQLIGVHSRRYDAIIASANSNPSIAKVSIVDSYAVPINTFLKMSTNLGINVDKSVAQIPAKTTVARGPSSDEFYVKGLNRFHQADFQGAIENFTSAIQANPKATKALISRGDVRYEMKDYREAIADYTQAIEIDPGNTDALLNRGNANYNLGDLQAALADYEKTISLDPKNSNAYNNRGRILMNQGNLQKALADFNLSIRLNPRFAGAYNNRGNARRLLGDLHEVISDFNRALAINPQYAEAFYNRGLVRYSQGNTQEALKDYNEAIRLEPNFASVYVSRGNARNDIGDKQGAIEDYTQAISSSPNLTLAFLNRGNVRNDLGDSKGAIEDYTQSIRLEPNLASAYDRRGTTRALTGDRRGGLADLQKAADLYNQQGDRDSHRRTLEKIRLIEK